MDFYFYKVFNLILQSAKKEFQENYLFPLREIVYSILTTFYLLNISWLDKKRSSKYVKRYIDVWTKSDRNSLENYVLDLYINKVLEDNKKITLNEKKKLRKNDFEVIKTQIKKDSFKIKN